MTAIAYIATAMGLAWASGINLYATVAVLGILGRTGNIALPPELVILTSDAVIAVAVFMYIVEFFIDKIPGLDSAWDLFHTFVRIPAGAIIAAGAVGEVGEEAQIVALLLGAAVSASAHTVKASGRLMLNTSPEPVTNITASIGEDIAAVGALWLAFNHPYIMLGFVIVFVAFTMWFAPKIWRAMIKLYKKALSFFHSIEEIPPPPSG